jgi:hypothetical protein
MGDESESAATRAFEMIRNDILDMTAIKITNTNVDSYLYMIDAETNIYYGATGMNSYYQFGHKMLNLTNVSSNFAPELNQNSK